MGSKVKAICQCGIDKNILIGGGMMTFRTTQYFPFFCKNCKDIVQGNIKSKNTCCPSCYKRDLIPYNNPFLEGVKGENTTAQTFDHILTDGTYKCPKCNKYTLRFIYLFYRWD